MEYVASFSGGKDSTAMVLRLMEEHKPLTKVVFFDAGMEYKSIYRNAEKMKTLVEEYGAEFIVVKPPRDFLFDMFIKPINAGKESEHFGYDWCGGNARWATKHKTAEINRYLKNNLGGVQRIFAICRHSN